MFAIPESDRRREGFSGDVPVVLCDGQAWHLPRPRVRFRPARSAPGAFGIKLASSFGTEYVDKVEAYYRITSDESSAPMGEYAAALMDLAVCLLLKNYELTDDELAEILWFDFSEPEDEANAEMRKALTEVILGITPKKNSPTS